MILQFNLFQFLLDFFNMLVSWSAQLWNVLTYEFTFGQYTFQLWQGLVVVGAVALVGVWLVKLIV